MLFLSAVNVVRRSHFIEHQRPGLFFSAFRGFLLIRPLTAIGIQDALTQAALGLLAWASILLIAPPAQVSICPGLKLPVIPIGFSARFVGALFGFRFIELLPATALLCYCLAAGTLPDAPLIICVVLILAFAFGVTRAIIDGLSLHFPRVFYRSPFATILLLPIVISVVGSQVGVVTHNSGLIGTAVLFSVFPLYHALISTHGSILLTITVPSLTSSSFRSTVLWAMTFAALGALVGNLFLGLTFLLAAVCAIAIATIAGWWLAVAWGSGYMRSFLLLLAASVLAALVYGVVSAEQSPRAAAVIASLNVIVAFFTALRLHRLRDSQLRKLFLKQPVVSREK